MIRKQTSDLKVTLQLRVISDIPLKLEAIQQKKGFKSGREALEYCVNEIYYAEVKED